MKVLILAAGYGTRLYPLTIDTPKPLIKINSKSLIDILVGKAKDAGIGDITVVTNDKFYHNFLEWSKNYSCVDVVNDNTKTPEQRLGAIGDIEFALDKNKISEDILVLGGDNLFSWDLKGFSEFVSKINKPTVGLYDVKDLLRAQRFGIVEVDKNNKILSFEEKPKNPKTTLAGTCIYFLPKNSLGLLSKYGSGGQDKDTTGQYISWLCAQTDVYGYAFEGLWLDIGHKDALDQARKGFSSF